MKILSIDPMKNCLVFTVIEEGEVYLSGEIPDKTEIPNIMLDNGIHPQNVLIDIGYRYDEMMQLINDNGYIPCKFTSNGSSCWRKYSDLKALILLVGNYSGKKSRAALDGCIHMAKEYQLITTNHAYRTNS